MIQTTTSILFATDLSKHSTYALKHAAGLAKSTRARLHILHVAQPISDDALTTMRMFIQDEAARTNALASRTGFVRQELKDRQNNFWNNVSDEDKEIRNQIDTTEVIEGYPAEVILRRARELKCDLIVLGAHSHGFSQTFLGSVAKRVLRRADIPTLVVPYTDD